MFYIYIKNLFTTMQNDVPVTNWTALFLVPCALTAACALAFLLFFKPVQSQLKAA
jgi:hypothetical protein